MRSSFKRHHLSDIDSSKKKGKEKVFDTGAPPKFRPGPPFSTKAIILYQQSPPYFKGLSSYKRKFWLIFMSKGTSCKTKLSGMMIKIQASKEFINTLKESSIADVLFQIMDDDKDDIGTPSDILSINLDFKGTFWTCLDYTRRVRFP